MYMQPLARVPPSPLKISVNRACTSFAANFQLFCTATTTAVFVPYAVHTVESRVYVVFPVNQRGSYRRQWDKLLPLYEYYW